ncbi:hypothetical protein [Agaribacter marinus]|uniref:MSHA biogenesis protein MshQ n=1 Tax=Agaribacter marinus TaxID=1431249 RepID=A0AA37SX32_9ALTE|nr:hypothetical protein [Agaribacter marinus]GLR70687.1 hypothetical protein GCM10007852_15950 [Agaribacter marinus]
MARRILIKFPLLFISLSIGIIAPFSHANVAACADAGSIERTRFLAPEVVSPESCLSEKQVRNCANGELTGWSGSYQFNSCKILNEQDAALGLPLFDFEEFTYLGGFRLPHTQLGDSIHASLNSSKAVFTYNSERHSIFIVGSNHEQQIAEFSIPNINFTDALDEFDVGSPVQDFTKIFRTERVNSVARKPTINGLAFVDGQLLVNYSDRSDTSNTNTETSIVLEDANDLSDTRVYGPYKLSGGLHASGWLFPIPEVWQSELGGDFLAGVPSKNFIWHDSQGPTAYAFNVQDVLNGATNEEVETSKLLGFSFNEPLHDTSVSFIDDSPMERIKNTNLHNDMWTMLSNAAFGFIIPDTSTYVTIGTSAGHYTGVGYRVERTGGSVCANDCAYGADDTYAYYWLWDLNQLADVYAGTLAPSMVRPYKTGAFQLPFGTQVSGGAYDASKGLLYLSSANADTTPTFARPPVFFVYQLRSLIGSTVVNAYCNGTPHGENIERIKFENKFVDFGQLCETEVQTNMCNNGAFDGWSGSYEHNTCQVLPDFSGVNDLPLLSMDNFEYKGGFRLSSKQFGESPFSSTDFSQGIFTLHPDNNSFFIVGHPRDSMVAEMAIPPLVNSDNIYEFNLADTLIQPFTKFHETSRVDTGINNYFRVTGLEVIDGGLMVNYINWYDANGTETDTSVFFDDADALSTSSIKGPYQLHGAAHSSGWLSKVPAEWIDILGGTHISGAQAGAAISSRLSVGPSAFAITPSDSVVGNSAGAVDAVRLMDFPLSNILYDKTHYDEDTDREHILNNADGLNDLWTYVSGAGYGFIMPGTSTYVTVGRSGGHASGIGYKITQDDGRVCGGPCPYASDDYASYYWLWDVNDLVKVKLGFEEAHNLRPYSYGEFPLPIQFHQVGINGGAFDANNNLLYVSIPNGDTVGRYSRPPLILAFEINIEAQ